MVECLSTSDFFLFMEIDKEKQKAAQERAKALLKQQEKIRIQRRLSKFILDLEQGRSEVLLNNEFLEHLPQIVEQLCQADDCDHVKLLFDKLGESACSEKPNLRERAVMALSLCSELLFQNDQCGLMDELTKILVRWLRVETTFLSSCNTVCRQLQENGIRMLQEGRWKECDYLLETFYQIQAGRLGKSNAIRSVVSRAQEAMAADYILEELTLVCLRGRGERRQNAEKILIHLGRKAALHLLEYLLACNEKEDRFRLIGLVPATGYVAVSVLKEYLKKDLPWYGTRNIILMISAMNDPELIPLIMPCLEHKDIRVQQQVVDCIREVAGENMKNYFLSALALVSDELKGQLIVQLGQLGGGDISEVFLDLFAGRDAFSPHVRDDLLKKLIVNMRLSNSVRAVNLLNMLIDERKEIYDPHSDSVVAVAKQTLQILDPRLAQDEIKDPVELVEMEMKEIVTFDNEPVNKGQAKRKLQRLNEEVAVLLGKGEVSEASLLLYEKSIEAAKEKDFDSAEMFRDRILEVDPNALTEVIRAGELIEEERSSAISSHHLSIWQDLYDTLTTEEFNALYYILQESNYSADEVIVEQGMVRPCLYFINSGQVRLSCRRGRDEIFLKRVNPSEIVGASPFFNVSVWTVTLTALSNTQVHILHRDQFLELLEQFPGMESSLNDYCTLMDTVPELIKMSGDDRRQAARYPLSLLVKHTLLDEYGNPGKRSFRGELADISTGGLSFFIRISRKENARLLLGRGIRTTISLEQGDVVNCVGNIVAVRFQQYVENDYSVHVQFKEVIHSGIVKRIVHMNKRNS